ncbi:hypothetical protein DPF_0977 [Desulfoplanes formicivorans]|uniref:Uncharacterized protein n=1 Tax=Desulfoplanes formicivorans TaxID=1592317 RepID=A0A194AHM6_9BACT|nr:hypothetical protein DPF_0977 [Desulfoplanes formicivorans]
MFAQTSGWTGNDCLARFIGCFVAVGQRVGPQDNRKEMVVRKESVSVQAGWFIEPGENSGF